MAVHKVRLRQLTETWLRRELKLDPDNAVLVEDERRLQLDCRQRFINDVLGGVTVASGSTLQLKGCELREFDVSGSGTVSGSSIQVDNSVVELSSCSVRSTTCLKGLCVVLRFHSVCAHLACCCLSSTWPGFWVWRMV